MLKDTHLPIWQRIFVSRSISALFGWSWREREYLQAVERHDYYDACTLRYFECRCGSAAALREGPYEMASDICRICGAGLDRHGEMDHGFEPLDLQSPSRESRMDLEEYKRVYHEGIQDVKDMTPEQIVDHIAKLELMIVKTRITKYAASMKLVDIERELTDEQRKVLREKSASYKVKIVPEGQTTERAPRAPSKTAEQKALESIMKVTGMSEEQAIAFINKTKKDHGGNEGGSTPAATP